VVEKELKHPVEDQGFQYQERGSGNNEKEGLDPASQESGAEAAYPQEKTEPEQGKRESHGSFIIVADPERGNGFRR